MKLSRAIHASALALSLSLATSAALANKMDASDFVEDASEINAAEIPAGQLALEKAHSTEVKAYARKMVDEHKAAKEQLATIAKARDLEPEDDAGMMDKAKSSMLANKDGKEFDVAYAKQQVSGHEDAIELFEEASQSSEYPELKQFATTMLPSLREHLAAAKKLDTGEKE